MVANPGVIPYTITAVDSAVMFKMAGLHSFCTKIH